MMSEAKSDLYKDAGVDIDLAHDLLGRVKETIGRTRRPEVLAPIGGFGGLFQIDLSKYTEPVMVSSVDGVGTKLMVAAMMEKYDTVGFDIVNHCIDDIAVQGAEPVYFMDYLGIGRLRSPLYEEVLSGLAEACLAQDVTLLGGETAEMPGMYGDDFDLVGCITGIVDKSKLITGDNIAPGNVIVGLGSSGLHTNGYSLARKVLFETAGYSVDSTPDGLGTSVGEALLAPHVCYWPAIKALLAAGVDVRGMGRLMNRRCSGSLIWAWDWRLSSLPRWRNGRPRCVRTPDSRPQSLAKLLRGMEKLWWSETVDGRVHSEKHRRRMEEWGTAGLD